MFTIVMLRLRYAAVLRLVDAGVAARCAIARAAWRGAIAREYAAQRERAVVIHKAIKHALPSVVCVRR